ncbi:kinase-like domain-containing protein, partial [Mycena crocata]
QLYAFKRFKDVGLGKDIVSLNQNCTELVLEIQRLVQLGWLYAEFERRAKSGNVQIEALRVTECHLAFELTPQKIDPSVASGYKDVDIDIADVPVTWLMEPFRPGSSQKWSRTNQHPSHPKSAVGSTANAFAHFVYATFGTIAVADIQTSRARIGNTAADVMFDLTTHTTEGNSGVGDHGTDGLKTFCEQHECVSRCEKLNLGDLVDPNAPDSGAESE